MWERESECDARVRRQRAKEREKRELEERRIGALSLDRSLRYWSRVLGVSQYSRSLSCSDGLSINRSSEARGSGCKELELELVW